MTAPLRLVTNPADPGPYLLPIGDLVDAQRADDLAVVVDVATARRAELVALAADTDRDDRVRLGLSWAVALADLVLEAARGVVDPTRLRFHHLPAL